MATIKQNGEGAEEGHGMRRKEKQEGRIHMFKQQMADECRVAKGEGCHSLRGDST